MKKFLKYRVLSFACVLSILVSFLVVPASAGFGGSVDAELPTIDPVAFFDADLMASEMQRLFGDDSNDRCAFFSEFAYIANKDNWSETSRDALAALVYHWNTTLGSQYSSTASLATHRLDDGTEISYVRVSINDSRLGGSRNNWTWCLNDGAGKILVDLPDVEKTIVNRGQWLPLNETSNNRVEMKPYEEMFNAAKDLGCSLYRVGNYWVIKKTGGIAEYIFCNENGERFVARYEDDMWASGQDRPTDKVTENGDIIEGDLIDNSVNLDLEGMTMLLPGGTLALIDKVIYDESTKSYHIDSHDTYNYEVNNYYTWNYYINYTSITYIGQTEEYNKYYEVYYELPDGRSSADLTKEDLEQLNLSVDVIPYGRSADDTSLRSLYHFDGDTKDSSYWNYCTDFTWNKGASLTYMDAGVFEGALYLDETEHDFTITLPSNLGSSDFTIQWRYYQSATAAPQTDSYVYVGGDLAMNSNGAVWTMGSTQVQIPIGSWNEVAMIRHSGTLYFYLNGVCVSTGVMPIVLNDQIRFVYGNQQQTFKYFDELRAVNYALAENGANYTPTAVPHDTNLSLVLPTDSVPVADEYWDIDSSGDNMLTQYGMDDYLGFGNPHGKLTVGNSELFVYKGAIYTSNGTPGTVTYPQWGFDETTGNLTASPTGMSLSSVPVKSGTYKMSAYQASAQGFHPMRGMYTRVYQYGGGSYSANGLDAGTYTLSMVASDGSVGSFTFTLGTSLKKYTSGYGFIKSMDFNGYRIGLQGVSYGSSGNTYYYLGIWPLVSGDSALSDTVVGGEFVYLELIKGSSSDLSAEFVESVTIMDKDQLNTPTLAVRTDIEITSYQIGGVRPSLPEKGMVWALVENERIASLQIYNGQAWEGVDGRIWTGERWIPMSSYNIITLQDLYDIVDATPNYEYIYSEAGFWAWWQKSWNAFTEKLFLTLGAGGAAGGTSINPDKLPSVPDDEYTAEDDGWSFIELLAVLKDGTWNVITGVVSTAYDGFYGFVQAVSDSGSFFDYYDPDNEQSIFFIPLEEGASVWD